MKKVLFLLMVLSLFTHFSTFSQIVFSEDFDGVPGPTAGGAGTYSFPSGWTLINNDNLTPAPVVSYVNEAWERREDLSFNVTDSCAFSTSWYSPAGAADDWMITPAILIPANGRLKWNAVTYDSDYRDGYEVRIGSSPTLMGMASGTQLFQTTAENTTWTAREVSLAGYSGQTLYIGFHNNSNDKFLLLIDDIVVDFTFQYDLEIIASAPPSEYSIIPVTETSPLNFEGKLKNVGTAEALFGNFGVSVTNENVEVFTATSTFVASLASGATSGPLNAPGFIPQSTGSYTATLIAEMFPPDQNPENDTLKYNFEIDPYVYARDNGVVVDVIGIGSSDGGFLGQEFELPNPGVLGSVSIFCVKGYPGRQLAVQVWDKLNGVPNAIIARSDTILYDESGAKMYDLGFKSPVQLAAGTYVFTAYEFDSLLAIGNTSEIFTPGTVWVNWPANPLGRWANVEEFGDRFAKSLVIRPNFCPPYDAQALTTDGTCFSEGSVTVTFSNPVQGPLEFNWSTGAVTTSLSALPGNYSVTVTDGYGCQYMTPATIQDRTQQIFTTDPIPTGIYSASEFVSASVPLVNMSSVTFQAGMQILLGNDFQVPQGAIFTGEIIPCINMSDLDLKQDIEVETNNSNLGSVARSKRSQILVSPDGVPNVYKVSGYADEIPKPVVQHLRVER